MRNIRMTVAYDGSGYSGFQYQDNALSVQKVLNKALNRIFGEEVKINAASRTDAGVHAYGQVINVRTNGRIPQSHICRALLSWLPSDIAVLDASEVGDGFHARYDAVRKDYIYKVRMSAIPDPFTRNYVWRLEDELDVEEMNVAAGYLCGTHDFAAFCSAGCSVKTTIRTIYSASWQRYGEDVILRISGNGFLYNMVRIIAGTCVDVGRGKRKAEDIKRILNSRSRSNASKTAPAGGLYLARVHYGIHE